jgi:hypothetical protein
MANEKKQADFAFGKENYRIMLVGIALVLVGFALMTGGGSNDPQVWNEEVYNFRRITLAPLLVLAGFVINIYAIVKKAKD